ncbi:AAA family ATPase, partial [Bifidobacterium animalis]|uniref:AAA family ATPase n=1 Tax=Bifidobacterium animalis TaxID=28025 RepID=UPI001BCBC5B1
MSTVAGLALDRVRSWTNCVLDFKPGVNMLEGPNGLGKTNIVEALEVLSTGSSHRASTSQPLVEQGFPAAAMRANIEEL